MQKQQIDIKTSHHLCLSNDNVKFYWQIESGQPLNDPFYQLVLPSLHTDLIFIIRGSLFVNGIRVNELFVSPVLVKWKEIELTQNTVLFGIRLNPIYFHSYSGIELNQLEQAPNPLKYVLSDRAYNSLFSKVFEEENFETRVINLNKYFYEYFQNQKEVDSSLLKSLDFISKKADTEVGEIAEINGYTERWVQKIFKRKVGISPNKAIQISRFNRFLTILANKPGLRLSEICYEAGYSDQSHLIHDFKKFTSYTPKCYLKDVPTFIEIMNCK